MRHVFMAGSVAALLLTGGLAWAQGQGQEGRGQEGGQAAQGKGGAKGGGGAAQTAPSSSSGGVQQRGGSAQSGERRSNAAARQERSSDRSVSKSAEGRGKDERSSPRGTKSTGTAEAASNEKATKRAADADRKARSRTERAERKSGRGTGTAQTDRAPVNGTGKAQTTTTTGKDGRQITPDSRTAKSTGPQQKGDDRRTRNAQDGTIQRVRISDQQRVNVRETLLKQKRVNRINRVNFAINVGTRVPRSVRLARVPTAVIAFVPAYRNYRYFYVEDRICIVEPSTYEIVDVIYANDAPGTIASGNVGTIVLSDAEARAWIGRPVFSRDDQQIGVVVEVVRERGGQVVAINADVGNYLGIGERRVRVDVGRFRLQSERVVLDVPAEATGTLPPA